MAEVIIELPLDDVLLKKIRRAKSERTYRLQGVIMEELIKQLSQDLQSIATASTYDWWMLLIAFLGVIVAITVAVFTYKIYIRQLKLLEEQKIISDAQTKISEKQTEIMEQQNKIALFEKQYEVYGELKNFNIMLNFLLFNNRNTNQDLLSLPSQLKNLLDGSHYELYFKKIEIALTKIQFVFDLKIEYKLVDKMLEELGLIILAINNFNKETEEELKIMWFAVLNLAEKENIKIFNDNLTLQLSSMERQLKL